MGTDYSYDYNFEKAKSMARKGKKRWRSRVAIFIDKDGKISYLPTGSEPSYLMQQYSADGIRWNYQTIAEYDNSNVSQEGFFDKLNNLINRVSPVLDVKSMLIEGGVASSRNVTIWAVEAADVLRATGSREIVKYLGVYKSIGIAGSVITTGYSSCQVYTQFRKGE